MRINHRTSYDILNNYTKAEKSADMAEKELRKRQDDLFRAEIELRNACKFYLEKLYNTQLDSIFLMVL